MSMHWTHAFLGEHYYAVQVDEDGAVAHTHPIPFDVEFEAARAAARLNARDEGES